MKTFYKIILIGLGSISVALGIIGIFLPILPTTPFLLLGTFCYLKSSKKLYNALINNKYLGNYIKNYYEKKGIPLKSKIIVLTLLWVSMSYTIFFVIDSFFLKLLLLIIAILVTYHILSQQTLGGFNHDKNKPHSKENDDFKINRICD